MTSAAKNFAEWLSDNRGFTRRSALDVMSRFRRVARILSIDRLSDFDEADLINSRSFQRLSMTVKSQLKRAAHLAQEYEAQIAPKRKNLLLEQLHETSF